MVHGLSLSMGMWNLPGSGIEPVSPALAGGFFTTELPGKPRNSCLIGVAFQFYKMKRVLERDGSDSNTIMSMYLIPLNCTLGNLKDGKFCYVYFITIKT